MKANAYAIILAGGNGERFWPFSTPERPKQFLSLFGGKPLILQAVERLKGLVPFERILVITAERLLPLTRKTLPMIPRENIIGEPCRRNTAPAVAVACGLVKKLGGPDAIGCVLTADQIIKPAAKFRRVLRGAIAVASKSDSIVTMGINPTYPATGFGYIESGKRFSFAGKTVFNVVKRFVEKPDEQRARRYLATGKYSWNAGMFIWSARTMEAALKNHAPDIATLVDKVVAARSIKVVLARAYPTMHSISIDYAVMEKISNILVAKSDFDWDDVGSWTAVQDHFPADKSGNVCVGSTIALNTKDSVIATGADQMVAVVGLSDVVVACSGNTTLVCAKKALGSIREVVQQLPN